MGTREAVAERRDGAELLGNWEVKRGIAQLHPIG